MKETFTPERSVLRQGQWTFAGAFLFLLVIVWACYPHWIPIVYFGSLCALTMWAAWYGFILDYYHGSITLDGDRVHFTHVDGARTVVVAEVIRAHWQGLDRLTLDGPDGRELIYFDHYRPHRRRLMAYFRERLRPEVQVGWRATLDEYLADPDWGTKQLREGFRSMRRAAATGPVAGLACGALFLYLTTGVIGVDPAAVPTVTGSVLADWTAVGALVSAAFLALIGGAAWLDRRGS